MPAHEQVTRAARHPNETVLCVQASRVAQCQREQRALAAGGAGIRHCNDPASWLHELLEQSQIALAPDAIGLFCHTVDQQWSELRLAGGIWAPFQGTFYPPGAFAASEPTGQQQTCVWHSRDHSCDCSRQLWLPQLCSVVCVPIIAYHRQIGSLSIGRSRPITESDVDLLQRMADLAAGALYHVELDRQTQHEQARRSDALVASWQQALQLHDAETSAHSQRVLERALHIAGQFGFRGAALDHLRRGVLLHDIGKLGIPTEILHKRAPLTPTEWQLIRRHPLHAVNLIGNLDDLRPALDIPRAHHERWDGSGYPYGLFGEQIPLAARLFAVIDVWDALGSDRPYRQAWSADRVRAYIAGQAGRHFDPRVVEVFLKQ